MPVALHCAQRFCRKNNSRLRSFHQHETRNSISFNIDVYVSTAVCLWQFAIFFFDCLLCRHQSESVWLEIVTSKSLVLFCKGFWGMILTWDKLGKWLHRGTELWVFGFWDSTSQHVTTCHNYFLSVLSFLSFIQLSSGFLFPFQLPKQNHRGTKVFASELDL